MIQAIYLYGSEVLRKVAAPADRQPAEIPHVDDLLEHGHAI